ncbi:MAG: helix-turn-helix transcriptional regulator [Tateyamaria sp.]|nr:helix-turn-helix transcriptional regulator [Tateyamaria sp.]MBT6268594.1 helix-turn-helix transcriptional regulator [Tateyamaria sp.]MBT6342698.1 helix-turn-helix transcriptional regulator [Tateyamaria sp.]MBT7446563.1 helix-turn-helix transcriptional regulator [Tateyamaria sp.]
MCPIGLASYLLGDKWIPIIIRDIALFDRRTFNDLIRNNLENISSGSLSSRLKQMVHLNLLHVENSEKHVQKKLYFLSEAGISFVPIIFDLASWTQKYRSPSVEIVSMLDPYTKGDKNLLHELLQTLREIHINKTIEPEPLWWMVKNQ